MRCADHDCFCLKITTVGAATIVVVLYPKFRTPEWRPVRAFMFVAMGLSAVVPVGHGLRMYGLAELEKRIGLSWLVAQGLLYILGAAIYAVSTYHPPLDATLLAGGLLIITTLSCLGSGAGTSSTRSL